MSDSQQNTENQTEQKWKYDPGDDRHKHHWSHDYAAFAFKDGKWIGKCPNTITLDLAEKLLNEGIPLFNPRKAIDAPNAIFNVHEGVIYKAVPTLPGYSYHGYPEIDMPNETFNQLLKRAEEKGCKKELIKWLKKQNRKLKMK